MLVFLLTMKIGFCFNVFHEDGGGFNRQLDSDSPETIAGIRQTLESLGHEVREIEADETIFQKLAAVKDQIDLVFNIAEGLYGDARESWVPMACEILKIPYTHSRPTVHAIKLDKTLTKLAVAGLGAEVPKSVLIGNEAVDKLEGIDFPVIIKPNSEGSSMGVFDANVVESVDQLNKRLTELRLQGLEGKLLAEEYIDGREFTVGMLGNGESVQVLPVIEQNFDFLEPGMRPIAGYELKWLVEDKLSDLTRAYTCPANLNAHELAEIETTSKRIFNGLGVWDCARIDYRMDKSGKLYFLEINTLPGINPNPNLVSYFPLAARKAGITYEQLLQRILELAGERQGVK